MMMNLNTRSKLIAEFFGVFKKTNLREVNILC